MRKFLITTFASLTLIAITQVAFPYSRLAISSNGKILYALCSVSNETKLLVYDIDEGTHDIHDFSDVIIRAIRVSNEGQNIYLGTDHGLTVSNDYGRTWNSYSLFQDKPFDPGVYKLYVDGNNNIYAQNRTTLEESTDNGQTWEVISADAPQVTSNISNALWISDDGNTIYDCELSNTSIHSNFEVSWDKGKKWTEYFPSLKREFFTVDASDKNHRIIYLTGYSQGKDKEGKDVYFQTILTGIDDGTSIAWSQKIYPLPFPNRPNYTSIGYNTYTTPPPLSMQVTSVLVEGRYQENYIPPILASDSIWPTLISFTPLSTYWTGTKGITYGFISNTKGNFYFFAWDKTKNSVKCYDFDCNYSLWTELFDVIL